MSSSNKHSLLRWIFGIALGVATNGITLAGNVPATFATNDTLTAAKMNEIATAINDNDTRVDGMQTGVPVCLTGMTRVGPTCVDNARTAGSPTWNDAVNACRAVGKRLLTPSEYIAAKNQGTITALNGEFEWVDSVSSSASAADNTLADGYAGRMVVGYMGPATAATIGGVAADGDIFFANNAAYDAGFPFIFFRCAR